VAQDKNLTYSVVVILAFVLLLWMFFQYLKVNYDDYNLETYIQNFEKRNKDLAKQIEGQYSDYLYYTSDAYLEKYAKGNLGLRLPGEEVIVFKETTSTSSTSTIQEISSANLEFQKMSNTQKWYFYFFGDKSKVEWQMLQSNPKPIDTEAQPQPEISPDPSLSETEIIPLTD
jgi:predicted nucleotidyltransferase